MSRSLGGQRRYRRKPNRWCACWTCAEGRTKRRIITERILDRETADLRNQRSPSETRERNA